MAEIARRSIIGTPMNSSPYRRTGSMLGKTNSNLGRGNSTLGNETPLPDEVDLNDDEAERSERRRRKDHSKLSPTPDRRRSLAGALKGLTNQQVSEHYANCIKLSAENKINMKNAFSLQLIDYMAMMLKTKDSEMNMNFQMASCTLDASTKIYSYRVDSIYNDTLKIAGDFGHAVADEEGGEGLQADDTQSSPMAKIKKKRTKKSATIEQNTNNLDMKTMDLQTEIDPVFHKISSGYEGGRLGGGFLANVRVKDDTHLHMLHGDMMVYIGKPPDAVTNCRKIAVPDLSAFQYNMSSLELDPVFGSFKFNGWSVQDEEDTQELDDLPNSQGGASIYVREHFNNEHAFDPNAIPEAIPEAGEDDISYGGMDGDHDGGQDSDDNIDERCCSIRQLITNADPNKLRVLLATQPQEYSYFDTNMLSAWAGPNHWKMRNIAKDKNQQNGETNKTRRVKVVEDCIYDTDGEDRVLGYYRVTRATTKLRKSVMDNNTHDRNAYPTDYHMEVKDLLMLSHMLHKIMEIRQEQKPEAVDDEIDDYDYDNVNDSQNFCAEVQDDENPAMVKINQLSGYDVTELTYANGSQTLGNFTEDNLVAAPNKVARNFIPYARTAKKMDMKRLKGAMWELIAEDDATLPSTQSTVETTLSSQRTLKGGKSEIMFDELYAVLPYLLPTKMGENLSISLAVVALLHLANEKVLQLDNTDDLENISIKLNNSTNV